MTGTPRGKPVASKRAGLFRNCREGEVGGCADLDLAGFDCAALIAHDPLSLIAVSLGAVFSLFVGFYYWFPKMTGRMYNELLGQIHFWVFFIGVNIVFFPQHFLGLDGMPRRYPDYPAAYAYWNHISSIGYLVMLAGMVVFFVNVAMSMFAGKKAGDNPWGEGATTLEWTLSSPPPFHQFETLPVIEDHDHH